MNKKIIKLQDGDNIEFIIDEHLRIEIAKNTSTEKTGYCRGTYHINIKNPEDELKIINKKSRYRTTIYTDTFTECARCKYQGNCRNNKDCALCDFCTDTCNNCNGACESCDTCNDEGLKKGQKDDN